MRTKTSFGVLGVGLAAWGCWGATGDTVGGAGGAVTGLEGDLSRLSLEQLMNVEVTSAGKKAERLTEVAAAMHVVTQEDLHRSGVTSLAEAMREVPGLDVARVDAHNWAISSRGFNGLFANKLLVMMDGRTVYTPVFSGVYWDVQDTLLEDVDRVEVIRGPGASLWGANAVNGVINVITKPAKDTPGVLLTGGGGMEESGFAGVRYGGQLGTNAFYRVYGKWFDRDESVFANGDPGQDGWWMGRGGFRADWTPGQGNLVTLQGDIYGGREQQVFTVTSPTLLPNGQFWKNETSRYGVQGGNVLGRWTHTFSEGSEVQVQAYFDRAERDLPVNPQANDTFDVEGQHRFQLGDRQEVVWGLGYRRMEDQLPGTYTMAFIPERRGMDLFSGFVQDEIGLVKEKLPLTLGVRVENNDFTGVEVQPNARLMWRMAERQSVWGAVSRAVRTPSRAESDALLHQPLGFPLMTEMRGNPEMAAEKELAYELGHRWQPHPRLALDTALFYQDYDELLSLEPGAPVVGFPTVIPVQAGNLMKGESYGVELAPRWQVTDWCRLEAAYTFLELNLHRLPGSGDTVSEGQEGQVPEHQVRLAARLDLDRHWQVDAAVRYVGELPDFGIRAYVAVDARLAWLPRSNIEVAVVGQSLLDDRHPEFTTSRLGTQSTEVERSVFARLTVRF